MLKESLKKSPISYEELITKKFKLTPMIEQYIDIKKCYIDYLLLFRMGDFYEVFFEDAVTTSRILNIALTHRGKVDDIPIPMAGIPHHAANIYVDKLVEGGVKVAICEQVEDPKEAIGIVKRAVTQIVSPGIPYDLSKAQSKQSHFIISVSFSTNKSNYYLSAIDYTTGEFFGFNFQDFENLIEEVKRLRPKEFLAYMGQWDNQEIKIIEHLLNENNSQLTYLSEDYFNIKYTKTYLNKFIPNYSKDELLLEHKTLFNSTGALSYYMQITQKEDDFKHLRTFKFKSIEKRLKISYKTLKGLEIIPNSPERYQHSLLGFLDKTQTSMGKRLLYTFITSPLYDLNKISERQNIITKFINQNDLISTTKDTLAEIRDIERILAKINRGNPTPSDLINLGNALNLGFQLKDQISFWNLFNNQIILNKGYSALLKIASEILETINNEMSASTQKGNLINEGICSQRDKLANLAFKSNNLLLQLEKKYQNETGVTKLRIKSNNVFGYFVEVPKSQSSNMPEHFRRKQTLVNNERYTTKELSKLEDKVVVAKDKLRKVEREIFKSVIAKILNRSELIHDFADIIANIDVLRSLSEVSLSESFSRPHFSKTKELNLKGLWHPIIKNQITDEFVPHNISLNENKYFGLITGPNMAGKTTLMREVAIMQLMAQIGSYVPAKEAKLRLCDALFSRLGASDDIINGQSTFMVEMTEAAEIIRHATQNSLIILDEVGRGTSTYDGLSIAWAMVEYLVHTTKAFCLFATHYHELIHLIDDLSGAQNFTIETISQNETVTFTYKLLEEGASESFGIYVAKLAGLPKEILLRSTHLLRKLENNEALINDSFQERNTKISKELPLFMSNVNEDINFEQSLTLKKLRKIDLMNTTPLQALNILSELKKELD